MTRRRDYVRSLELPGYWSFTAHVISVIKKYRKLMGGIALFYGLMSVIFVGIASQDTYFQLSKLLDETGSEILSGGWGSIGQASLLLLSGISGSLNPELTDAQKIYAALIFLLTWLATVWLLRSALAGKRVRLRDGLYSSGAPIVATSVVFIILIVQLLPVVFAILAVSSAISSGLFDQGVIAMIVTMVAGLLVVMSAYWIVATFFALVIVTLPGMYPFQALRSAGDIVIGRRIRILLRMAWLIIINVIVWVVVMLPVILGVRALGNVLPFIESLPIVPIIMTILGSIITIWSACYIYILYRKVVEDDAKPA